MRFPRLTSLALAITALCFCNNAFSSDTKGQVDLKTVDGLKAIAGLEIHLNMIAPSPAKTFPLQAPAGIGLPGLSGAEYFQFYALRLDNGVMTYLQIPAPIAGVTMINGDEVALLTRSGGLLRFSSHIVNLTTGVEMTAEAITTETIPKFVSNGGPTYVKAEGGLAGGPDLKMYFNLGGNLLSVGRGDDELKGTHLTVTYHPIWAPRGRTIVINVDLSNGEKKEEWVDTKK